MEYNWKILELKAAGDLITAARYFCAAESDDISVETEGWWYFQEPKMTKPFANVTEADVIGWIKQQTTQDGKNQVEGRLAAQVEALANQRLVVAPWLPQTFTPDL